MKINEIFSALFTKVRRAQGPKGAYKNTDSQLLKQPDEVKLAKDARFISTLKAEMNKIDEARAGKVSDIKRRLDEGTYQVDAEEMARKVFEK